MNEMNCSAALKESVCEIGPLQNFFSDSNEAQWMLFCVLFVRIAYSNWQGCRSVKWRTLKCSQTL